MLADSTMAAHCNDREFGRPVGSTDQCYTKLLPRGRPFLALSGHADELLSRQLLGVKQTRLSFRRAAADDPKRTS